MQLFKTISFYFLYLIIPHGLYAQTTPTKPKAYKHELGLNVTNLLTDLLGNNNRTDPGVYLISYKFIAEQHAFRAGLTSNVATSEISSSFIPTRLKNQNFQLRLGYEKRTNLSSKLQYYVGIDAIGGYKLEENSAATSTSLIVQSDKIITVGGGPVLGFQFALFERLLIGTEGSMYAALNNSSVNFSNISSSSSLPPRIPNKASQGFNLQTNLPKFLFLILKF
jgi:hypothetical protein